MKYLIAIDSDGTLRHSDGTISEKTKKIIKEITKKGNVVVIFTARPRYYTAKVSKEVGITDYLVSSNGSEIYDNINKKIIWSTYINNKDAKKLYNYAKTNDVRIMFVLENTEYVTHFKRNDNQILINENNINNVFAGQIKQIMIIGKEKSKIKEFQKIVADEYKMKILDSSDDKKEEVWFSIVSNETSKGIALAKLSEYLKIENTIAIGNDKNDISMFKVATKSVAVDNASDYVKSFADYVTLSNDEDGVAVFLEKLVN